MGDKIGVIANSKYYKEYRSSCAYYLSKLGWNAEQYDSVIEGKSRKFDWFSIPNCNEALKFSYEKRCEESFKHLNGQLPFGCHKWENENEISFWKDYIK